MSIRRSRLAHATGIVTVVLSLAAVTSMLSTGSGQVPAASAAHADAHVFVPTGVALPSQVEEPAPTF